MTLIAELRKLQREDCCEFQSSLGHTVKHCLNELKFPDSSILFHLLRRVEDELTLGREIT